MKNLLIINMYSILDSLLSSIITTLYNIYNNEKIYNKYYIINIFEKWLNTQENLN
jgi:hypothetical protein